MRIDSHWYLVGSGSTGFDLTNQFDCNIYLLDTGSARILFDAGAGMGIDEILAICQQDGIATDRISHVFLTHAHADHAGGAAYFHERLGTTIVAGQRTAEIVRAGDEEAVSLTPAKVGGIYPQNYVYRAASVQMIAHDGQAIEFGDFRIEPIFTPGHSHDHHSYLVSSPEKRYLVAGDALFYGGRVILQNTYDCDVQKTIQSIQRLSTFEFDALLPGHLVFSLKNGRRHVETALAAIDRFACPPSI